MWVKNTSLSTVKVKAKIIGVGPCHVISFQLELKTNLVFRSMAFKMQEVKEATVCNLAEDPNYGIVHYDR